MYSFTKVSDFAFFSSGFVLLCAQALDKRAFPARPFIESLRAEGLNLQVSQEWRFNVSVIFKAGEVSIGDQGFSSLAALSPSGTCCLDKSVICLTHERATFPIRRLYFLYTTWKTMKLVLKGKSQRIKPPPPQWNHDLYSSAWWQL